MGVNPRTFKEYRGKAVIHEKADILIIHQGQFNGAPVSVQIVQVGDRLRGLELVVRIEKELESASGSKRESLVQVYSQRDRDSYIIKLKQ